MIRFRALGTADVVGVPDATASAILAQPKRLALLAFLVLGTDAEWHRRDTLVALLWPELSAERARAALRKALHHLRQALGATAIESRGDDEVRLVTDEFACDAREFLDLIRLKRDAEALELYAGDLLPGLHVSEAPEFERWLDEMRSRLRRSALDAAMRLAHDRRAAGELAAAASWARRAAGLGELEERPVRLLIELLIESDDGAAAVRAYDRYASRLAQELELTPGEEIRALIASARSQRKPQAPTRTDPRGAVAAQTSIDPAPVGSAETPASSRASLLRSPLRMGLMTGAIIVASLAGAAIAAGPGWRIIPGGAQEEAKASGRHRIAVLPFTDHTGDSNQAHVVDGLHDALISELARISALEVDSAHLRDALPEHGRLAGRDRKKARRSQPRGHFGFPIHRHGASQRHRASYRAERAAGLVRRIPTACRRDLAAAQRCRPRTGAPLRSRALTAGNRTVVGDEAGG